MKTKFHLLIKWFLVFTVFNLLFEAIGQLILFFTDNQLFLFLLNIPSISKYLFIQSFLFFTITLLTIKWVERKHSYLIFPLVLFLLFNIAFLLNLKFTENGLVFMSDFPSFSFDYFRYIADISTNTLLHRIPIEVTFDGGFLYPHNTIYFYIFYAIIPFVYFSILTFISRYIVKKHWQQ